MFDSSCQQKINNICIAYVSDHGGMDIFVSNRGFVQIYLDGFIYRKDKQNSSTVNWRCKTLNCKGRIVTNHHVMTGDCPLGTSGIHSHPPHENANFQKKLSAFKVNLEKKEKH